MKILSNTVACSNDDGVFCYFGWPSVAYLPDGRLALAASGFRMRHVCPFGKGVICYSSDEGKSWTRPAPVIDTPLDDRDSGVVSFGKGRVIFTSFNNSIAAQRAWMERLGEDTPEQAASKAFTRAYIELLAARPDSERLLGSTYRISDDGGTVFGPVRLSPVTSPHGPMPTKDGGLMYIGRRFTANDSPDQGGRPYLECWRLGKDDAFEYLSSIPNIPNGEGGCYLSCEPHALELPDGRILVHIRVQGGCFTVYQSESSDGGRSFTAPRRLLEPNGGSPAHLLMHSSGALLSVYGYRNAPYGIRYMLSQDMGRTWMTDLVLTDEHATGDLGYPASVEISGGRILTVYYVNEGGASRIRQIVWEL